MQNVSFGDLASVFRGQLNNTRLKSDLHRLADQLATGKTADLRAATGGDLGNYASIESALNALNAYNVSANEAALFVETVQRSLETIQNTTSEIGPALLLAGSTNEATIVQSAAVDARARFATVVSVLNTKVADRALLSGTDIRSDAIADSEVMLADLQVAIAAETTAAGIEAVVEGWFDDPGGGFETSGYLGGTTDLAPFRIGPDEDAGLALRGDHQNLRDVLKGYAMAALVADGALSGNHQERVALVSAAGTRLLTGDHGLSEVRASVGTIEARIDSAKARNSAESSALEMARAKIVEVDPYRTATDLQAAEAQLETLYAITARMSRLSLADYMR